MRVARPPSSPRRGAAKRRRPACASGPPNGRAPTARPAGRIHAAARSPPARCGHPRTATPPRIESRAMSRPAISLPPQPKNEPVKDYAPGSPERAELQRRLRELENERIEIPLVIGGEDVKTRTTFEAVEPHKKKHVLADVHAGGPAEVERRSPRRARRATTGRGCRGRS